MGWRRFFRRDWWDEERARELQSHLDIETDDNIALGMSPAAAREAARLKLGDAGRIREEIYAMNTLPVVESLWQDARYGIRQLARNPGFTAVAVLTLAIGIGGVTIIYSVIRNILLDPFPYANSERMVDLIVLDTATGRRRGALRADEFLDYQEQSRSFEAVIGTPGAGSMTMAVDEGVEDVGVAPVTPNTFAFLGVPALIGRGVLPSDGRPNAPPIAVLSHKAWVAHFGSDPAAVGRAVIFDGQPRTIVGVMPPRFTWHTADAWIPGPLRRSHDGSSTRDGYWFQARLKRGVSVAQAEAEMNVIAARRARLHRDQYPEKFRIWVPTVIDWVVGRFRGVLYTLFGAVGLLLLIACCNVANMLLARASARERELTLRAALGAGRARLVRQMLVESLLLALAGGAAGSALAYWGLALVALFLPQQNVPYEVTLRFEPAALVFSLVTACATTLVFGLLPALHGAKRELVRGLKKGARGSAGLTGRGWVRSSLVIAEVAISMVLLLGAGLLMRGFVSLVRTDLGIDPSHLVMARVSFPKNTYTTDAERFRYYEEAVRRLKALPGVTGAAEASDLLGGLSGPLARLGGPSADARAGVVTLCTEGYLPVLGLSPLRGRLLTGADIRGARRVAVVDQRLASALFPDADPIGQRIEARRLSEPPASLSDPTFEIVGIVRTTLNNGFREQPVPQAYVPSTMTAAVHRWFVLKTTTAVPEAIRDEVRKTLREVDPNVPGARVFSVEELVQESFAQRRFTVLILAAFAGIGLVLVAVGVYGVMSYTITRRMPELALRLALGASRSRLLWSVVGSGGRPLALGLAVGAAASVGTNRLLADQAWNTSPSDPVTLVAAVAISLLIGLAACLAPAARVTRMDPMATLRQD